GTPACSASGWRRPRRWTGGVGERRAWGEKLSAIGYRQPEDEGRAAAGLALQEELSLEEVRQAPGDRQPQPGPHLRGRARRLLELLEHPLVVLRSDPGAGIRHPELESPLVAAEGERHAPLVGELHGVREEVEEDLPHARRVGH